MKNRPNSGGKGLKSIYRVLLGYEGDFRESRALASQSTIQPGCAQTSRRDHGEYGGTSSRCHKFVVNDVGILQVHS